MTLLAVENLSVGYRTRQGLLKAVDGVSFRLDRGKSLGFVGESGCGKTTIGMALLRLLPTQERKRMRLEVPAEMGVFTATLSEVIAQAWPDAALQKRLRAFLEDAADPVGAAIAQRRPR